MRIGVMAANLLEGVILRLNVAPRPILETQLAFTMARAIMAGVDVGAFAALEQGPRTAAEVAMEKGLDPRATGALLRCLVGCDYLGFDAGSGRFCLRPVARRWLLDSSPHSLANKMRFQQLEWQAMAGLEDYVRTGRAQDLHQHDDAARWRSYQLGMVDIGRLALGEAVKRTPIPAHAEHLLDIGGSGGTYAAAFLRARSELRATILELPAAAPHARPIVESHGLGERLCLEAGDVLSDELGEQRYDFVFMSNVAHHLSAAQNLEVARKAYRALRRRGIFCVQEIERTSVPSPDNQLGGLMDLYFAMTSCSGTWSEAEIAGWLREAGLRAGKPVRFRTAPGLLQVWGERR